MVATRTSRLSIWQPAFALMLSLFLSSANSIRVGPVGIEALDFARCSGPQETFGFLSLEHAGDEWTTRCHLAPLNIHLDQCYWSGFQNEYSNNLIYECRENHVIREIEKLYDQDLQDLRLNFKCCRDKDLVTSACTATEEVLHPNWELHLAIVENYFLVGWTSYHSNLGRSHQFKLCKLTPSESDM